MLCLFLLTTLTLAFGDILYGPLVEDQFFQNLLGAAQLPFIFNTHPYGIIASFGFVFVGSLALLYGLDVSKTSEQVLSLWALASAVGVTYVNHFIVYYMFWELLTITAACLIMLKRTPHAKKMGYRFLFFQLAGGLSLFLGIIQHYTATGSWVLSMPEAGLPFFIIGIGMKAAFIPLHFWLPWGYPAASFSTSVMLSVLTTKVGVFAIARLLPPHYFIALMGAAMAVFGVCYAIIQTDLRKLLSFHIISQVGYMVAGVGLGLSVSVDGGLLHLVNHMIYKALLFMSAGALIYATGKGDLTKLQGDKDADGKFSWQNMSLAAIAAVGGALAIAGMPPFNGYVSKYLLKYGTMGVQPVEWMLLLAGIGTALSFCKFVYFGFIKSRAKFLRFPPLSMQLAMVIGIISCLFLGINAPFLSPLLPYSSSLGVYSLDGVFAAFQPIFLGVLLFVFIKKFLDPAHKHKKAPMALPYNPTAIGGTISNSLNFAAGFIEEMNNAQIFYVTNLAYIFIIIFYFYYLLS